MAHEIPNNKFYKYSLQLAVYMLILKEEYGIEIYDAFMVHLRNDGSYLKIEPIGMLYEGQMLLDEKAILNSIAKTGCVVTAEEHNYFGGLGESISRVLAKHHPTPQEFVAVNDSFGESGTPAQLMEKYKLNDKSIVKAAQKAIQRKTK